MQLNQYPTKLKFLCSLFLFSILHISANAQNTINETQQVVGHDPLLWKDELKLNADQREKIQKINLEFYQNIYRSVSEEVHDHSVLQSKAKQYLQQRSEEIWNAFNPNQRRKWKRLWSRYTV
jgi:hypothetical protein